MAEIARHVLKRVATVVVATSLAGSALLTIPEEVVESLLDPAELGDHEPDERVRLLRLVSTDPRASVRRTVAARMADVPVETRSALTELTLDLARDPDPGVRRVLSASVGSMLGELAPLDATELLLTLASSEDERQRFVAASALAWPFEVVGARTAIAHLARDPSSAVRLAAQRAAETRQIDLSSAAAT